MEISRERLLFDLDKWKGFTDTPGAGVTRFSYGKSDMRVRNEIGKEAAARGLSMRTDPIGNLSLGLPGSEKALQKICVGSHMDTVRNGGWLDGIYGVVSALEILRTLAENGSDRASELEVVIFTEEEGSNFGSTMTGSKFITGVYGEQDLDRLKNEDGVSLREMLEQCAFPPFKKEDVVWDFSRVKAMLELHIEQGPVLEQAKKSIGIVDTIFGMTTIEISIEGIGNHAGATPMGYRKDALVTAALCIGEIERIARADPEGILVATVGKAAVFPNCFNVIPERVVFTAEVRHKQEEKIREAIREIEEAVGRIAGQRGTAFQLRTLAHSRPFPMDASLIRLIEVLAGQAGIGHQIMDSGAVHDACVLAPHVPSAMIFVPSIGGRSHVPFENTHADDLVRGAQLLFRTVLAL